MEVTVFGPLWSTIKEGDWNVNLQYSASSVHNYRGSCYVDIEYRGKQVALLQPQEDADARPYYTFKERNIPVKIEGIAIGLITGFRMGRN